MHRRPAVLIALLLACALGPGTAAAAVQFTVSPHAAKAASRVSVRATHLSPQSEYILLFVPAKNKKLERFLGTAVTNKSGAFSTTLALPPVPYCGKVTVYLLSTKKTVAHVDITVKGCNPKSAAPPPPPHS